MKPAIAAAVALFFGVVLFAQQRGAQKVNDEVRLRATVQAVVPLADFSGEVIPVHFDPRFALTVRIESAAPAIASFASGAVVTFAIHSPSKLFEGDRSKGKTYDFSLCRKVESGKVKFFGLCQLQDRRLLGSCE